MIKTLIVDDEPLALDILENYVERIPSMQLVARCDNAVEASELLNKEDVDLVLLDIQMPQMSGIELVKSLSNPPKVVFTTAYPNYAVEGFELDAVDYLLKPISFERFMKAINRVKELMDLKKSDSSEIQDGDNQSFIFVKSDKKLIKVFYKDILYIEGLKDYVIIRMEKGRVITLQTMKSLESKMPAPNFKRIHRSYIMNIEKIKAIVGNMVEVTEKNDSKLIPIGKNYRDELLKIINENRL